MLELNAQPLTPEAFAPFGDVIDTRTAEYFHINAGRTRRYHDLAKVETLGDEAHALISIFVSQPVAMPLALDFLERHPLGSQAFMPLDRRPYLVVVAPIGERVRARDLHAFLARGDQGVNYHAGVWHHALLALDAESDFLVVDRGGPGDNCETYGLAEPVAVTTQGY